MKTWLQPRSWERRYSRLCLKEFKAFREQCFIELEPIINKKKEDEDNNALILAAIAALLFWWNSRRAYLLIIINHVYSNTSAFNDNQFRLVVKGLTGLTIPPGQSVGNLFENKLISQFADLMEKFGKDADIYREELGISSIKDNWKATQDTYIDSIGKQTVTDLELIVRSVLGTGIAAKAIKELINKKLDTSEGRLDRFAKDQVSKLNAKLVALRANSLGIDNYVWKTQRDERVRGNPNGLYPKARPSHFHREGKVFRFSQPPEDGNPGEPPGCRCWADIRLPR